MLLTHILLSIFIFYLTVIYTSLSIH